VTVGGLCGGERYYTVKIYIALKNPSFTGFLAEGLEETKF